MEEEEKEIIERDHLLMKQHFLIHAQEERIKTLEAFKDKIMSDPTYSSLRRQIKLYAKRKKNKANKKKGKK